MIEHVAAYMSGSRIERLEDRAPWKEASATWKAAFREMAVAAWQALTLPAVFGSGYLTRPTDTILLRIHLSAINYFLTRKNRECVSERSHFDRHDLVRYDPRALCRSLFISAEPSRTLRQVIWPTFATSLMPQTVLKILLVFSYLTVPASYKRWRGDAAAVQAVMDRIAKDSRHDNISYFRPITTSCRQFRKWTTEYLAERDLGEERGFLDRVMRPVADVECDSIKAVFIGFAALSLSRRLTF